MNPSSPEVLVQIIHYINESILLARNELFPFNFGTRDVLLSATNTLYIFIYLNYKRIVPVTSIAVFICFGTKESSFTKGQ